jgi:dihydrofolate synthase/folylpolyglutamate synthase
MGRDLQPPLRRESLPGEPGVGRDYPPPFAPPDPATAWLFSLNRFGIRPGLARIEGLLEDLGRPERHLRTIVVAGTNGKGSTTHLLATLLRSAGHRVATFTSPHLLEVYERIQVDGRPLAREHFAELLAQLRPQVERRAASWFETLTAVAVQVARESGVDFLCCEAGLGGRLDATNALPAVATLLTTVALDHQQILGETRAEIAAEKLGLLKAGAPFFCGVDAELRDQAFAAAVAAGAPAYFLDELARWETSPGPWTLTLSEREIARLPDPVHPGLRRNVALALLALTELERRGVLRAPAEPAAALAEAFLPGRFQLVLRTPDWLMDTGHNEQALTQAVTTFLRRPCAGRRILLFGGVRDKDLPASMGEVLRRCDAVLAAPVSLPRSRGPEELAALLAGWGLPVAPRARALAGVRSDLGQALGELAASLAPDDAVLVTGSCFLVAEVLYRLGYRDLATTRPPRAAAEVLRRMASPGGPAAGAA